MVTGGVRTKNRCCRGGSERLGRRAMQQGAVRTLRGKLVQSGKRGVLLRRRAQDVLLLQ